MTKNVFRKGLVIGIIILFVGASGETQNYFKEHILEESQSIL